MSQKFSLQYSIKIHYEIAHTVVVLGSSGLHYIYCTVPTVLKTLDLQYNLCKVVDARS